MATSLNIDQFNTSIGIMLKNIAEGVPDIVQTVGLDAIALIRNRIQEKGLNAQEQELAGYSAAYKKRKEDLGKDVGFTNLTLTGDMLRKLAITSAQQEGQKYVVLVGGKDKFSQDKIDGNSFGNGKGGGGNYGDILEVSDKEEEDLAEVMDDEIQKIINQSGFGQ